VSLSEELKVSEYLISYQKMYYQIIFRIILVSLTFTIAKGDNELCGIEPPKEPGGTCSGSKSTKSDDKKQINNEVFEKLVFDDYPENETEIW